MLDDIAVIRSCVADGINHSAGVCQMNTGSIIGGRPSLGSWATYGLGTENQNLPAFVVLQDNQGQVVNGPRNWSAGFMPAVYQGIRIQGGIESIPNLNTPEGVSENQQRGKLDLLKLINQKYAANHPEQSELDARLNSYELAFRMQSHAPEAVDLSKESERTKNNYGLNDKKTSDFGTRCLLARRLVERGVRFVQLYSGGGPLVTQWDAHDDINSNHEKMCGHVDQPIAALLKDLKARGLLDSTLVVWASEFGRLPNTQGGRGRDHNPHGFTMWIAGGGVKGGQAIGATDEMGLNAIDTRISVNDFHATLLHLLGMDHEKLIYPHLGKDERLTDVAGRVVQSVFA
jgi:hypothetical protein